jgi:hypothetical protein
VRAGGRSVASIDPLERDEELSDIGRESRVIGDVRFYRTLALNPAVDRPRKRVPEPGGADP